MYVYSIYFYLHVILNLVCVALYKHTKHTVSVCAYPHITCNMGNWYSNGQMAITNVLSVIHKVAKTASIYGYNALRVLATPLE